ncbi:uncharacterized protein Z518_06278 [Rhinocladiella mackenziei CBS 650.93]|uniref:Replication factor C subunit 1 n=1 Tax=Rhinocladiella mackenziei CBS 650.93 TaxID=1442369 RepID=A0A0D2IQF2_9EURO|nr:uncharacterized protein Z518_06278 [Rhinocladiella mackenziei CBS 650.93]KIX05406.1 hypothetical protein Z518_06278 [Rhinocladiella mackenziei CBS 650.93]
MPSDIRSFFGGGGGGAKPAAKSPGSEATKNDANGSRHNTKQRGRPRKVISDDEEDEVVETKPKKPSTPKGKKVVKEAVEEETTSSAYFASSKAKPVKSTPIRSKPTNATGARKTSTKEINGGTPSNGRRSARKTASNNNAEDDDESLAVVLKAEEAGNDDIFNDLKSRKVDDDYEEGTDDDDVRPPKKVTKSANGNLKKIQSDEEEDDLEMAELPAYGGPSDGRRKRTTAAIASRKRKPKDVEEDDDDDFLEDDDETPKKKSRKNSSTASKRPRGSTKKEEREENKEIQDIFDGIPTVRAPTPPLRDEDKKFKFKPGGGNANVAPPAAGTAEIPVGAENCLAGLTFVFTGVLNSLGREEGQNLVKQYGGKVTTAPSKKTSYVVIGSDAGPKKLETIQKLGIKTINEEGLFALIKRLPANGGDGKAAEAYAEKQAKEEEMVRKQAEEMEDRERQKQNEAAKVAKAAAARTGAPVPPKPPKPKGDDRLWVDKYAPDTINSVCGNKGQVEGLQRWLRNWQNSARSHFKKAGADGKGIFRAALLYGPPGVGKTTAAHLVAKLEGYDVVESNASDTRNKKLVEAGLTGVLDTTSILGYFAGDGKKVDPSKKKLLLIMDEVDGMSAGDRGGVGAMAAIARKTNIPLIMICNERNQPKMKPLYNVTAEFQFRRPTTDMIRGRIATILFREGMKLPPQIMNALIEGCNGDIRQIINMISTIKLDNKDLDFNDTKAMSKAWEKHVILKPWDIVGKILRPQMFSASSTATLNDKTELYFNDHEFSYLMLQENYLKSQPSLANSYTGRERNMKLLELFDNAASSISDGDLVDRMIHGSQQQWSLMPTHAIFSFVRPASYVYGNFNAQVSFTSWLGQNSKQMKMSRFVKEIQGHMRLRSSADRHETRQQYLPALWNKTIAVLQHDGRDAVQDVIDFMDSYYLTKDDFDAMLELGVGPMDMENVKLESSAKAAFTRTYNSQNHPMPFVKASHVLGMAKGGTAKKEIPDLEEAIEESEPGEVLEDAVEDDDDLDLEKDKYVKIPKKKAASATNGGAKGKGKRKKKNDDDDIGDGTEDEPKKKKTSGGGGRGGRKGKE